MLTPHRLCQIGEALYGPRWMSAVAADLHVTYQTVWNWSRPGATVPDDVVVRLRRIFRERFTRARSLLWPRKVSREA